MMTTVPDYYVAWHYCQRAAITECNRHTSKEQFRIPMQDSPITVDDIATMCKLSAAQPAYVRPWCLNFVLADSRISSMLITVWILLANTHTLEGPQTVATCQEWYDTPMKNCRPDGSNQPRLTWLILTTTNLAGTALASSSVRCFVFVYAGCLSVMPMRT